MALNVGTLVTSAIRPNDSLDPIATAFSTEIKGGNHTKTSSSDRDLIIFERRDWGMMCYVVNDNKTYQLSYNYSSTNIMDNNNWIEFSGSGGGSGGEWIDSVLSVRYSQPLSPLDGDRYLVGLKPGDLLTGLVWSVYSPGYVVQWESSLTQWLLTIPTDGMSVRVDDEDNSIYKYEGIFNTGEWNKEKSGQVRSVNATTSNGWSFSATTSPAFGSYLTDMTFLTKFSSQNSIGTASIDINSMGSILIKKPTPSGLVDLLPNDIQTDVVYTLLYDGINFQLNRPYVNEDLFNVKYYIEPNDYVVVPEYYQYWVYSNLEIAGTLENYGQVIVANGSIIMSGGTLSNYGDLIFLSLNTGLTPSYNDTDTIEFSLENTIYGTSVSAMVMDSSLTSSKLNTDTNGGATAGYILSVDTNGYFQWILNAASASSVSADNGLTYDGVNVVFGGTLSQNTQISGNGNNLIFGDMDNIVFTSSVFDVVADGLISLDAGDGSVQILGDNIILSGNNIEIAGNTGIITMDSGEGLVYADDYSAGFVTHSLVDRNYVDTQVQLVDQSSSYDNKTYFMTFDTSGNGQFSGLTISNTPRGYVTAFVNGLEFDVAYGSTSSGSCYFSGDGGINSRNQDLIVAGDELYWNGIVAGTDLFTTWRISLFYLV